MLLESARHSHFLSRQLQRADPQPLLISNLRRHTRGSAFSPSAYRMKVRKEFQKLYQINFLYHGSLLFGMKKRFTTSSLPFTNPYHKSTAIENATLRNLIQAKQCIRPFLALATSAARPACLRAPEWPLESPPPYPHARRWTDPYAPRWARCLRR